MKNEFDETEVQCECNASDYRIDYYIYRDNKDREECFAEKYVKDNFPYIKNTNRSCFVQIAPMLSDFSIKEKKWPNRLLFLVDFKKHNCPKQHPTFEEIHWWLKECKKYRFLPDYISEDFTETGNFVLKIDTLDLNTIYAYLIIARLLQEEPYFIKAVKYLVTDRNINFYTAFAVASRCCITNKSHHAIYVGKKYPFSNDYNSINKIDSYNLREIRRLKSFLSDKSFKVRTPIKNLNLGTRIDGFNLHITLDSIETPYTKITLKELIKESLLPPAPKVWSKRSTESKLSRVLSKKKRFKNIYE